MSDGSNKSGKRFVIERNTSTQAIVALNDIRQGGKDAAEVLGKFLIAVAVTFWA